jgi:hypothetical protein
MLKMFFFYKGKIGYLTPWNKFLLWKWISPLSSSKSPPRGQCSCGSRFSSLEVVMSIIELKKAHPVASVRAVLGMDVPKSRRFSNFQCVLFSGVLRSVDCSKDFWTLENGADRLFEDVGTELLLYATYHPRREHLSFTSQRKCEIILILCLKCYDCFFFLTVVVRTIAFISPSI